MKKSLFSACALLSCALAFGAASCGKAEQAKYTVYAPNGATALALANAISAGGDPFDYRIIDASTIAAQVTGNNPAADFCVMPVNLASKLLGTGENYRLLGTVTNGNFYFLTAGESVSITPDNLSQSLVGKTVGVVQLSNVPGLTFQAVLGENGIPYSLTGNDGAALPDKVNLKGVEAANITPAGADYYLCPEPAVSAKIKGTNGKLKYAGSLQELYGGGEGYPQAVLVAKKSVTEGDKGAVQALVSYFEGSAEYLAQAEPKEILSLLAGKRTEGLAPAFTEATLTAEVVARCSVRYTPARECKARIDGFLSKLIAVNGNFANAVAEEFYYMG